MKNLFVWALVAGGLIFGASAAESYFYWGVDVGSDSEYKFSYATIKATSSSGSSEYLSLYSSSSAEALGTKFASSTYPTLGTTTGGSAYAGLLSEYGAGSKFLVELWSEGATSSDAATRVAYSSVAFNDVTANIFDGLSTTGATAYTFTSFIPEPTSGLLALLGIAALALRRKHAKVA